MNLLYQVDSLLTYIDCLPKCAGSAVKRKKEARLLEDKTLILVNIHGWLLYCQTWVNEWSKLCQNP